MDSMLDIKITQGAKSFLTDQPAAFRIWRGAKNVRRFSLLLIPGTKLSPSRSNLTRLTSTTSQPNLTQAVLLLFPCTFIFEGPSRRLLWLIWLSYVPINVILNLLRQTPSLLTGFPSHISRNGFNRCKVLYPPYISNGLIMNCLTCRMFLVTPNPCYVIQHIDTDIVWYIKGNWCLNVLVLPVTPMYWLTQRTEIPFYKFVCLIHI